MSAIWQDRQDRQDETSTTMAATAYDREWLARYAASHRRYCCRLYGVMALCAAAYLLFGVMRAGAQDTVPRGQLGTQSRTLAELRPGDTACTYLGYRVSKEGHVWVDAAQVAEPRCAPSVNWAWLQRLRDGGWAVTVKAPVPVNGWDSEYAAGPGKWVKAEKVEVVK